MTKNWNTGYYVTFWTVVLQSKLALSQFNSACDSKTEIHSQAMNYIENINDRIVKYETKENRKLISVNKTNWSALLVQ